MDPNLKPVSGECLLLLLLECLLLLLLECLLLLLLERLLLLLLECLLLLLLWLDGTLRAPAKVPSFPLLPLPIPFPVPLSGLSTSIFYMPKSVT